MSGQTRKGKKKSLPIVYALSLLHLFIGVNATISGLLLMIRPDGSLLQMAPGWLDGSPFLNYFIPGLVLFSLLGLTSSFIFYGLLMPYDKWAALKIHPTKHWAWIASLAEGIILITWIILQMWLTHYFWLQPVILIIAFMILLLTFHPTVKNFYSKSSLHSW